jgi:ABC-type siderophore export system fused ATPase/permease subunit
MCCSIIVVQVAKCYVCHCRYHQSSASASTAVTGFDIPYFYMINSSVFLYIIGSSYIMYSHADLEHVSYQCRFMCKLCSLLKVSHAVVQVVGYLPSATKAQVQSQTLSDL